MLLRIELSDFRSYRGDTAVEFSEFSAIVGPNGSGKSNLAAALQFVLCGSANDCVAVGQTKCRVAAILSTSKSVSEVQNNEDRFERILVASTKKSSYYINSVQCSQTVYRDSLAERGIFATLRNFLVLQGDVEQVAAQTPQALTRLVETVSG